MLHPPWRSVRKCCGDGGARPILFRSAGRFTIQFPSTQQSRGTVATEWPILDRRNDKRPQIGDRRPCPTCGNAMRFYERYVVQHGPESKREPAWVCQCGFEEYVRQER